MFRSSTFWILFVAVFGSLSSAVEYKILPTPLSGGVADQDFAITFQVVHEHGRALYNKIYFEALEIQEEYNFHVAIERNHEPICSGAILHGGQYVVTAASCDVKETDVVHVNAPKSPIWQIGQYIGITCVKNHPNFRINDTVHQFDFNIAIIRLNQTITSQTTLYPNSPNFVPKNGKITYYSPLVNKDLTNSLVVINNAPIISAAECRKYGFNLTDNMICAGVYSNQSFCSEDLGSPLFDRGILIGIKFWGQICSRILLPAVYTNVSVVKQWVLDTINKSTC